MENKWNQRTNHGRVNLFFNTLAIENNLPILKLSDESTFQDARIKEYETHGWVTLIAWFPLGFALLATKRYYKTKWFLMHNTHNLLGAIVVIATLITCMQAYAHVGWK